MIDVICETCNKSFIAQSKEIKRGFGRFCSRTCSANRTRVPKEPNQSCSFCSKPFYRSKSKASSKSGFVFCSRDCKEKAQSLNGGFKSMQPSHYGTSSGIYSYRTQVDIEKCNRCEYDEHKEILVVHHIDRNRLNNKTNNLEVLCPNCHALEHR